MPPTVKTIRSSRYGRYVLRWHDGSRWREKLTDIKSTSRNKARAERLAAEFARTITIEPLVETDDTWLAFVHTYVRDKLSGDSKAYRSVALTVFSRFEKLVRRPDTVADVTARDLTRFEARLLRPSKYGRLGRQALQVS